MSSKSKKKGTKPKKKETKAPAPIPEIVGTKNLKSIIHETSNLSDTQEAPNPNPNPQPPTDIQDEYKFYWSGLDSFYQTIFKDDSHHMKLNSYLKSNILDSFYAHFYSKYYKQLFLSFLELQSESLELPGITWYQIDLVIKQCDIFTHGFNEHSVDRIFKENQAEEEFDQNTKSILVRYEFMEFLCRVAIERYWMSGDELEAVDALDCFMEIFLKKCPNAMDRFHGLRKKWFIDEEIFKFLGKDKNGLVNKIGVIWDAVRAGKDFVEWKNVLMWTDVQYFFWGEDEIWKCWILSKTPILEGISDYEPGEGQGYFSLYRLEFFEFLFRLCECELMFSEDDTLVRIAKKLEMLN